MTKKEIAAGAAAAQSKGNSNMKQERIRYLSQQEKQDTRSLYEAAFPEDSEAFTDYYYQWKIIDNEVIVMEEEAPLESVFFHVMIHVNPYALWMGGIVKKIPYLVAVATHARVRRQGKMGRVMRRLLQDLEHKEVPFAFLLPADPAYYQGQGFVFFPCGVWSGIGFYQQKGLVQAASVEDSYLDVRWQRAGMSDGAAMAAFANRILEERCALFIRRDPYYYKRLQTETVVEHGGVLLLRTARKICGILVYAVVESDDQRARRAEVKELLLERLVSMEEAERICRNALKDAKEMIDDVCFPASHMMVRITSLRTVVPLLKNHSSQVIKVKVKDAIIDANNGCFQIETGRTGGTIKRITAAQAKREMDISQLTQELFRDTFAYLNEWV